MILKCVDVEELIGPDHEARAIWEFVGQLELKGFLEKIKAIEGEAGRTPFDPQTLISLWVYAYSRGIQSAREIERRIGHDPAFQWLSGLEEISYHTLSSFRVNYKEDLNELFAQILGILRYEGIITLECVTQDGTKIKANAGVDTFRRGQTLQKYIKEAERLVQKEEEADQEKGASKKSIRARERADRERKERLEKAVEELEKVRASKDAKERDQARASTTDPEARRMKQPDGGFAPSYNVQITTDAAAGAIIGVGLTQAGSDYDEMVPAMERVKETVGEYPQKALGDAHYSTRSNILEMHHRGIDFYGDIFDGETPEDRQQREGVDPRFRDHAFQYDASSQTMTCPGGKRMYLNIRRKPGVELHQYYTRKEDCAACEFQKVCCKDRVKSRSLSRIVEDRSVRTYRRKMGTKRAKAIYKKRSPVAEFSNLWIKNKLGLTQFSLRGMVKAGVEALWACVTYDIQIWIRRIWRQEFHPHFQT